LTKVKLQEFKVSRGNLMYRLTVPVEAVQTMGFKKGMVFEVSVSDQTGELIYTRANSSK
jgi:bifunctional DNA-binding transcriptional regulator/antitoxin component of YhaV-PrlF toxin-antitoxin module